MFKYASTRFSDDPNNQIKLEFVTFKNDHNIITYLRNRLFLWSRKEIEKKKKIYERLILTSIDLTFHWVCALQTIPLGMECLYDDTPKTKLELPTEIFKDYKFLHNFWPWHFTTPFGWFTNNEGMFPNHHGSRRKYCTGHWIYCEWQCIMVGLRNPPWLIEHYDFRHGWF